VLAAILEQVETTLANTAAPEKDMGVLEGEVTKEREREQQQQKQQQKQQLQEVINQFHRSDCSPIPWDLSVLRGPPPTCSSEEALPFYRLCDFTPRSVPYVIKGASSTKSVPAIPPIAFPSTMLQTHNFAPFKPPSEKPLRLKNVTLVLEWLPWGADGERMHMVVSLGEAEALRRYIRDSHRPGASAAIALALLLVPANVVLDATPKYAALDAVALARTWSTLHFWNAELFCSDAQTDCLLDVLGPAPKDDRRAFFEAALFARRRSRASWQV